MDVDALSAWLALEQRVILDAPIHFLVAVGTIGVGIWWTLRTMTKARFDNQQAAMDAREERLNLANERYEMATLAREQLQAQLADLQGIVKALPRGGITLEIATKSAAAMSTLRALTATDSEIREIIHSATTYDVAGGTKLNNSR